MHTIEGSSSIHGMDMNGDDLTIEFVNGGVYRYAGVGADTMLEMLNADSVGAYFATEIRPNFEGVPVQNQEEPDVTTTDSPGGSAAE